MFQECIICEEYFEHRKKKKFCSQKCSRIYYDNLRKKSAEEALEQARNMRREYLKQN